MTKSISFANKSVCSIAKSIGFSTRAVYFAAKSICLTAANSEPRQSQLTLPLSQFAWWLGKDVYSVFMTNELNISS
jgi:hypothetical protein